MAEPGSSKPVQVVGAGLVGSLLAIHLARRGHRVELHERRPDMRVRQVDGGRSINLAISTRGIHALEQVGLAGEALAQAVPMRGRAIHLDSGQVAFQPYGRDESECIHSISRAGLNRLLMTRAEETGRVAIRFERKIEGLAEFGADDVVIGTDGSASAIREAILRGAGQRAASDELDYGYKEILIPPGPGGSFLMERNALHIWPRGSYMLIALPNFDGSFTCTLFLPFRGERSFETLRTPEDVRAFFGRSFADVVPLIPDLVGDFFGHPTGRMVTVRCPVWSRGRALVLGDAAHAIVPFFGQGMNCGFEDITVLEEHLDRSAGDWERAFREFGEARRPDADAIADLALENFVEMRDRVADARFQLERKVEKLLEKEMPREYLSRYALVTFSRLPYRVAQQAGVIENRLLAELCAGLDVPERVDLGRARALVRERLSPLLSRWIS